MPVEEVVVSFSQPSLPDPGSAEPPPGLPPPPGDPPQDAPLGEPVATIPLDLLADVTPSLLAQPLLARLDESRTNLLMYLPQVDGADQGLDKTLQTFAKAVLQANRDNMQKGRLQRELPYWTTFVMNVVLFLVGLVAFGLTIYRGLSGDPVTTATFGGVTVTAIISTFLLSPITSLQRSNLLNTGLVSVINTYWTRLMYLEDPKTIDADLKKVTEDTVAALALLGKSYLEKSSSADGSDPSGNQKPSQNPTPEGPDSSVTSVKGDAG